MTSVHRAFTLTAAAAAFAATALVAPAATAATTDLQPEKLSRGADIAIAHIEGTEFVHGERRVKVGGKQARLIGKAGRGWLVGTANSEGSGQYRVVRFKPDDSTKVIKRGIAFWEMAVSQNGKYLLNVGHGNRSATPVQVYSTNNGKVKFERKFPGYPRILGMAGSRVLLSTWGQGVSWWDTASDQVTRLTKRNANIADLSNDLLATYTKDPYKNGCVVLSRLSSPSTRLWKSCTERIEAISPDGARLATVDILSDGIGPSRVWERTIDDTLLGDYTTNYFGRIGFESNSALLLEVNGTVKQSTVRCSEGACQNATDPKAASKMRISPGRRATRFGSVAPAAGAWQTPRS